MRLFRRKKITRPKNPLGMALYQYDKIVGKELGGLLKSLAAGKNISPGRADSIKGRTARLGAFVLQMWMNKGSQACCSSFFGLKPEPLFLPGV